MRKKLDLSYSALRQTHSCVYDILPEEKRNVFATPTARDINKRWNAVQFFTSR